MVLKIYQPLYNGVGFGGKWDEQLSQTNWAFTSLQKTKIDVSGNVDEPPTSSSPPHLIPPLCSLETNFMKNFGQAKILRKCRSDRIDISYP